MEFLQLPKELIVVDSSIASRFLAQQNIPSPFGSKPQIGPQANPYQTRISQNLPNEYYSQGLSGMVSDYSNFFTDLMIRSFTGEGLLLPFQKTGVGEQIGRINFDSIGELSLVINLGSVKLPAIDLRREILSLIPKDKMQQIKAWGDQKIKIQVPGPNPQVVEISKSILLSDYAEDRVQKAYGAPLSPQQLQVVRDAIRLVRQDFRSTFANEFLSLNQRIQESIWSRIHHHMAQTRMDPNSLTQIFNQNPFQLTIHGWFKTQQFQNGISGTIRIPEDRIQSFMTDLKSISDAMTLRLVRNNPAVKNSAVFVIGRLAILHNQNNSLIDQSQVYFRNFLDSLIVEYETYKRNQQTPLGFYEWLLNNKANVCLDAFLNIFVPGFTFRFGNNHYTVLGLQKNNDPVYLWDNPNFNALEQELKAELTVSNKNLLYNPRVDVLNGVSTSGTVTKEVVFIGPAPNTNPFNLEQHPFYATVIKRLESELRSDNRQFDIKRNQRGQTVGPGEGDSTNLRDLSNRELRNIMSGSNVGAYLDQLIVFSINILNQSLNVSAPLGNTNLTPKGLIMGQLASRTNRIELEYSILRGWRIK
ncbi:MAG: hypothetical protein NZO16_00200 [Deltaproteobacteria bacterium]|nr:hypothetical protein [Deltaproteobacteria bacterium]